jgi:HTH-type transcriptional regulator/antitoxin HigA
MNWKVIKTETQYQKAVKRAMHIFHAQEGTPQGDELAVLLLLIRDYEDRHITIPDIDPIEVIKLKMAIRFNQSNYIRVDREFIILISNKDR